MATVRDIITRTYKRLRVIAEGETPSASAMSDGLDALNDMIYSWATDGVDVLSQGFALNDTFVFWVPPKVIDEAQNTTPEQMKMFLTRLGFGSKMVITGDITQVDLPNGKNSGLATIRKILEGIDDISFMDLTAEDVVRHRLISDIVSAYESHEASEATSRDRQAQARHLR